MAPCIGICKNGSACVNKAKVGLTVCGKHMNQRSAVRPPEMTEKVCGVALTTGRTCAKMCWMEEDMCAFHLRVKAKREEKARIRGIWIRVLETLWRDRDPEEAISQLWLAFIRKELPDLIFQAYEETLQEEVTFFRTLYPDEENATPLGELEALAKDSQNVHTTAVNNQTRSGLELLLEMPVPADQETLKEIKEEWEKTHTRSVRTVMSDMRRWYMTETCRTEGDWLYRRALDGLWLRVKSSPAKDELVNRLWEECYESVRMCCDGHLSRLCNVLCGFDDAFQAPVSVGELLQQKMSAIAEKDVPVEEKVGEAWVVFEELAIPMEERDAWIEAF